MTDKQMEYCGKNKEKNSLSANREAHFMPCPFGGREPAPFWCRSEHWMELVLCCECRSEY